MSDSPTPSSPALGTASWIGAGDYDEGEALHTRATDFLASVKWDALLEVAADIRGCACHFELQYSLGHFNMVRCLTFHDGEKWVARMRMPELREVFGGREALDAERCMRVEVGTMRYLAKHAHLPIPHVHAHCPHADNPAGAPYMLMTYMHGNTASEHSLDQNCELDLYGTPDQDRAFRKSMAEIQMTLASLRFDKIGAIYETDDGGFELGPEPVTGKGPWETPEAYYTDWLGHAQSVASAEAEEDVKTSPSFSLPKLFRPLLSKHGHDDGIHQYGLANRDLGAHNVLVDRDFNIIGLIDFDGVMAAPLDLVAQLPTLTSGMQREAPGHVETRPAAVERIERERPLLERYEGFLKEAAEAVNLPMGDVGKDGDDSETEVREYLRKVAEAAFSDGASVVQGLDSYSQHQLRTNETWMGAFRMLARKMGIDPDEMVK